MSRGAPQVGGRPPPGFMLKGYAGFVTSALVLAVSPLVSIPAITSQFGAQGWASFAVGQSFGGALAVIVGFGWPLVGPARVARADAEETGRLLVSALAGQAAVLLVLLAPFMLVAALAVDQFHATAALTTVSAGVAGLVPTWLFVGRSSPGGALVFTALPSLLGAVLGSGLLLLGAPLVSLPITIAVAQAASITVLLLRESRGRVRSLTLTRVLADLRSQAALAGTQIASLSYINLPVGIFALTGASGLVEFAGGDRLYRLALAALLPVTQVFQGWVPSASEDGLSHRMAVSLRGHLAAGVVGGLGVALLTRPIGSVLFNDTVLVPWSVCLLYGAVTFVVMVTRAIGLTVLIPLDGGRFLLASAVAGSVVALVGLPLAALALHAPGAVGTVLTVELIVLCVQATGARRLLREHRRA